ncbi:hypothetical protein [Microseira sp. BLCC-F43]|uniref:hypothetical protein n=1 Tax=Microseira sp. BLCC-F43 TaxID=3153602 RepID=UPI0035B8C515
MARLLKRWESPRREGKNDKGRGGSARARQLKKQQKMLLKKLKEESNGEGKKNSRGGKINSLLYFFKMYCAPTHPGLFTNLINREDTKNAKEERRRKK